MSISSKTSVASKATRRINKIGITLFVIGLLSIASGLVAIFIVGVQGIQAGGTSPLALIGIALFGLGSIVVVIAFMIVSSYGGNGTTDNIEGM